VQVKFGLCAELAAPELLQLPVLHARSHKQQGIGGAYREFAELVGEGVKAGNLLRLVARPGSGWWRPACCADPFMGDFPDRADAAPELLDFLGAGFSGSGHDWCPGAKTCSHRSGMMVTTQ